MSTTGGARDTTGVTGDQQKDQWLDKSVVKNVYIVSSSVI